MEGNNVLRKVSLFEGLPEEDIKALSDLATVRTFSKNTIIISEGDNSDSMYVVLSGKVKVFLSDDEGKEIIINILKEGDYFGELALLDESPRSASVMTLGESKLAVLSKTAFDECLKANPQIALQVIKGLSLRLRNLTDNVKSLALMDVYGRVARFTDVRIRFEYKIYRESDDILIVEGFTEHCFTNKLSKPRRMPAELKEVLEEKYKYDE